MEKSTKILIGVGVVGVIGLLVYKKVKAAPSVTNTGSIPKKPTTKPTIPASPIIDPKTGKLTPIEKDTDPNVGAGSGTGGGSGTGASKGGGGGAVNNPDSNSGKFNKVDPNKKDENWIKALGKKQKAGGGNQKKDKKKKPKVNCAENPDDPICQKVKECYYNPYDPSCLDGQYACGYNGIDCYVSEYDGNYDGYDNNTYDYSYNDGGYDYSGGGYGGGYGEYYVGGPSYGEYYGYSDYGGFYSPSGGKGGNPSDYYY
jgi:hypothetical protein